VFFPENIQQSSMSLPVVNFDYRAFKKYKLYVERYLKILQIAICVWEKTVQQMM